MIRALPRIAGIVIGLAILTGCVSSQDLRYDVGRAVSTAVLQNLINPWRSEYRVALIHATLGQAYLIPAPGEAPRAEAIRGHQNFLWAQAAEQLGGTNQMSFLITRHRMDAASCPSLASRLDSFHEKVEPLLTSRNAGLAMANNTAGDPAAQEEILIDGAISLIHVVTADAIVTYRMTNRTDNELREAVAELSSFLSGCSVNVEPAIERIYGPY